MHGIVRAGVILSQIHGPVSQRSSGAPGKIVKIHHKVRIVPVAYLVKIFRPVRPCSPLLTAGPGNELHLFYKFFSPGVIPERHYTTLVLSSFHVEKDPGIIAAPGPDFSSFPVYIRRFYRRPFGGLVIKYKITLLDKPLVYAESPLHGFRPVIGHYKHCRVIVQHIKYSTYFFIQHTVILHNSVFIRAIGHISGMLLVKELPKRVMQAVNTDLHEHKELPGFLLQKVLDHAKMLRSHFKEGLF